MQIYPFFIAHAGCPHRCIFCRQEASVGSFAPPSPEDVFRSLDAMLPQVGGGEIAFYGGSFTLLPEQVQRAYFTAAEPHIREGRAAGFRVSTRPDALGGSTVKLLKESGVSTVEIGCQSFCPAVLDRSRRGHGPEEAEGAVLRLRAAGIRVGLQLMQGLPGGKRTEAVASLCRALELGPDFLRLYPTVVLRGTELEELWRAGTYRPLGLDEAVEVCADLLRECREAGVPVIRLGLQASPGLDGDEVTAGPYHPAFGQLVRSRLWRRALWRLCREEEEEAIGLHPADLADAVGHRRSNLDFLHRRRRSVRLAPHPELLRGTLQRGRERFTLQGLSGTEEQTLDR